MRVLVIVLPYLLAFIGVNHAAAGDVQRFPPPEFESGYILPQTTTPLPRAEWWYAVDVAVLLAALSWSSFLVMKKRQRQGIYYLTIFSLIYFGFYRGGCICPIGSIQNVTLALFDSTYALPLTVAVFFLLPLLFSLFFGRVFCAGVCPLGAIQDLVLLRPVKIPDWLLHGLGLLAYLYLGAAVYFAALGSGFIICEYDPFISIFRMTGKLNLVILGISFLVMGLFVGRPYCLFLCPYGVILNFLSRLSRWQVTVSPEECVICQKCEDACPFGAIVPPTSKKMPSPDTRDRRRLVLLLALAPILMALSGWVFSKAGTPFSRMHYTVRLAEQIVREDSGLVEEYSDAGKAFRDSGQSKEALYNEAHRLREPFTRGGWFLGGFMGLVIALKLMELSVFRKREEYEVDRGGCLACGRCFSFCHMNTREHHHADTLHP